MIHPIDEVLTYTDTVKLQEQINERRKMIAQMVGSLYPSILQGQIEKIRERLRLIP